MGILRGTQFRCDKIWDEKSPIFDPPFQGFRSIPPFSPEFPVVFTVDACDSYNSRSTLFVLFLTRTENVYGNKRSCNLEFRTLQISRGTNLSSVDPQHCFFLGDFDNHSPVTKPPRD